MWKHLGPVDVLDIDALLDAIGAREPAPGSGSSAALVGAIAAALCTKAARFSLDEGSLAQSEALRARLVALATEDAEAFVAALRDLDEPRELDPDRRDFMLGRSLERAAEAPLRIAESCADVAELAAGLAASGTPDLQPDAAAAAVLAHAAARAAAHLVAVNLGATVDDLRIHRARGYVEVAAEAARRAGA